MGASESLSVDPIEITDPFSVGVQLGVMVEYLDTVELSADATTAEFCANFILPLTKEFQCSAAEYLRAVRSLSIGKPIGFISHAWIYSFRDLINALVSYYGKDAYVWLDIACNNQHKAPNYPPDWWYGAFKTAISSIGKTVMVLAPWNDPIPLTRGWCIWELYCTIESEGCEFDIAMTAESEFAFVFDIDTNPKGTINKMLSAIDCSNSQCEKEEDKTKIDIAIKEKIGFSEMNKRIFEALRGWVIRRYTKELEKRKRELGESHMLVVRALSGLAALYENHGDYDKALPLYEECLEKSKTVLGENHPFTLTSLNNLATLYQSKGDYNKALPLFEECFKNSNLLFGETHPSTLDSLNNLASLYSDLGDYDKALPLYEECLEKSKSLSGENDPSTLTSLNNLALLYKSLGDYDKALPLYEECLEKSKAILGENHPDTLVSLNNLALLYNTQGDYDNAFLLNSECLERTKFLFGENHPATLTSLHNLAELHGDQGDYDKALSLLEECLEKRKFLLGENHPDTLASLNNLAALYGNKGDYDKALPLREECLEKLKAIFGENHPHTLSSLNNLAIVYCKLGEDGKALPLFEECLEKRKSLLGENHPATLRSLNNLAKFCQNQGEYDRAVPWHGQAGSHGQTQLLLKEIKKEMFIYLKNLFAESGYRDLNKHEKACICVDTFKLSHEDAATVTGLSRSSVGRAVISKRRGRDVGKK
jgi:tetratricopeptide (TPR) repeat protein